MSGELLQKFRKSRMETLPINISNISGGSSRRRHDEVLTGSGQDEVLVEGASASGA
jgi:hypothetical protein